MMLQQHDIETWDVWLDGRPVIYVSGTLMADLLIESGLRVNASTINAIAENAVDIAPEGKHTGWLFESRTPWADTIGAKASGREERIWFERIGDAFCMYYPSER